MIEVPHFLVSIPALKNLLHSCSEAATRESVLTCTSAVTRWNICQTIFCDAPKVLSDCSTFSLEAVACKYDDNFYFLLYKIGTILFVYSEEASFVFQPVRAETSDTSISYIRLWAVGSTRRSPWIRWSISGELFQSAGARKEDVISPQMGRNRIPQRKTSRLQRKFPKIYCSTRNSLNSNRKRQQSRR